MKNLLLLAFLISNGWTLSAQSDYYPPRNEWEARTPVSQGFDVDKLNEAIAFADSSDYSESKDLRVAILKGFTREPFHQILGPTKKRGGPTGVIIKNGYLVAQWGEPDRVEMTFSVTKSYLSTMAGLAVDRGLIADVHDKVGDYVWDGTFDGRHNSKISWHHLLQQSSDWSGQLWGSKDWADRPPREGDINDWEMRKYNEPGSVMEYNDVRVNVLAYSLLQVWRKPMPQVLKEQIMDPIDATPTWRWFGYDNSYSVVDGIQMQSVSGGGHSGGGLFINTWDHARFGYLFLRNGKWKDQQLISRDWIDQATISSPANESYGYMWWLNKGQREIPGLPDHIYYAAGFGGNFIVIDEKEDLVIVTRWLNPPAFNDFMTMVYAALKK